MADQKLSLACAPAKTEIPSKRGSAKRAALYCRVSTADQHPESQLYDLREMARQRGYEIVCEYKDTICGAKSKRPGLDKLLEDARRQSKLPNKRASLRSREHWGPASRNAASGFAPDG